MVVDKRSLRLRYCPFDRVQLLSNVEAGLFLLYHFDHAAQMTLSALEAFDDFWMGLVLIHDWTNILLGGIRQARLPSPQLAELETILPWIDRSCVDRSCS